MFVPPARAMLNSFAIALLTTLLALGIGIPAALLLAAKLPAWLAWLADGLFTLPLGVSAVMLGLGMIVAWGPLGMLASPWLIPLAHTLLAFPFVVRALAPALRARNLRLREVARCLGVSPFTRLWRIEIPLLAPALGVAMVLAFTSSLGEFGAALLLTRPEYPTVPMVIARLLGQPGASNYGQAMALSTLLMLASVAAFLLLERLQPRQRSS
jgi:thiamine transport system permease protein